MGSDFGDILETQGRHGEGRRYLQFSSKIAAHLCGHVTPIKKPNPLCVT